MSEHIDNSKFRKTKLKALILQLHSGESPEAVREELIQSLSNIPYGEVVEVEQELIEEGLPEEDVLELCDIHSAVLKGNVDLSASKEIPDGHPVDILLQENQALNRLIETTNATLETLTTTDEQDLQNVVLQLIDEFNQLMDVEKHYLRKEYLLFPYLEKTGITGPPKVMWGKHDEIREQLKGSSEILRMDAVSKDDLLTSAEIVLKPAVKSVTEMVIKEEEILFPMLMDALTDSDWFEIQKQSLEIGYCLIDPQTDWQPESLGLQILPNDRTQAGQIQLPSGSFSNQELLAVLSTLPVDITFVNKDDKVKFFSQSKDRIFQRNRAIINRDVRHCHPPASAHIVDKILEDFKSGKETHAPFWIKMGEKLVMIEYYALHDNNGDYFGTLEVSQDVTRYRLLEGEQRILSYE